MRGAWRLALGGGALTAALLAATQVTPSRLPLGIVVQGAILGTGTGLLAVGLVLTYRATRAINFAYGAIGGTGAALAVSLYTGHGWPWPVALMLAVIVGGAVGGLVERVVIRRFAGAPRLVLTIATIGLAQLLGGAELYIPQMLSTPSVVGGFDTPLDRLHIPIDPVIITGNDVLLAPWFRSCSPASAGSCSAPMPGRRSAASLRTPTAPACSASLSPGCRCSSGLSPAVSQHSP